MILPIGQRMHRLCDTCVWYDLDDVECLMVKHGYTMEDERTDETLMHIKNQLLPCRFHMTRDELCQILDPYFME